MSTIKIEKQRVPTRNLNLNRNLTHRSVQESMKRISILLALFAVAWGDAHAAPASTNSAAAGGVLMIDSSSMTVAAGEATRWPMTFSGTQPLFGLEMVERQIGVPAGGRPAVPGEATASTAL